MSEVEYRAMKFQIEKIIELVETYKPTFTEGSIPFEYSVFYQALHIMLGLGDPHSELGENSE